MVPPSSVIAVSHALPGDELPGSVLTNPRLTALMEEVGHRMASRGVSEPVPISDPEFPERRIGVTERRVLDQGFSSFDLALHAAEECLASSGIDRREVRATVVSTVTPDRVVPSMACRLQARLGLSEDCSSYDLSLGCNGFVGAIDLARRMLAGHPEGACVLVVAAEAMTRVLDASDRGTCPVFGDGSGAALLRAGSRSGLLPVDMYTDGSRAELIQITARELAPERPMFRLASVRGDLVVREDRDSRARVVMDGRRVFRDMVRMLPRRIRGYVEEHGMSLEDVDRFAFHQANRRLIEAAVEQGELGIPASKLLFNIQSVGNTTSASIPILLSQASKSGALLPGERVMLVGFGTGYSLGITVLEWSAA